MDLSTLFLLLSRSWGFHAIYLFYRFVFAKIKRNIWVLPEWNYVEATESIEFEENYFLFVSKMKITKKIVFYKFYKFCRIPILVTLKMKITKNSFLEIL